MSMINPTISATSQFITPFDILPNIVYTNPTISTVGQFNAPYDISILTNQILLYKNPNPTINLSSQFIAPYDIPNKIPIFLQPDFGINNYDKASAEPTQENQYTSWKPDPELNTNISAESALLKLGGLAAGVGGGILGVTAIGNAGNALFANYSRDGFDSLSGIYVTTPKKALSTKNFPINTVKYGDFRSRYYPVLSDNNFGGQAIALVTTKKLDGTAAAFRSKGKVSIIYASLSTTPVGPYSVFNLESWYGFGEHDSPNAVRSDFTLRSSVATRWEPRKSENRLETTGDISNVTPGYWTKTKNTQEQITPFRGDKVTVIDFSKRKLNQAYQWRPSGGVFGIEKLPDFLDKTQDFIKFYFTGPKLQAGNEDALDDIIVFRAVITALSENFNPTWTDVKMIGRADPNYIYTGLSRDLTVDFDVYATDRDELKPIYRKLNALAGYTAPTYVANSIALEAPWMRITIGDLYVQTPVVLSSLGFTYDIESTPWEINIEQDKEMMQVPRKISVSCGFNLITDYLPQKGGRFWSLAKRFEANATAISGDDNWLSDTKGNIDPIKLIEEKEKDRNVKGATVKGATVKNIPATPQPTIDQKIDQPSKP